METFFKIVGFPARLVIYLIMAAGHAMISVFSPGVWDLGMPEWTEMLLGRR